MDTALGLAIVSLALSVAIGVVAVILWRRLGLLRRRLRRSEMNTRALGHQVVGLWRDAARRLVAERHGAEAARGLEFHANSGEDAILMMLFDGAASGYVVEAGAFDGRTHSVSWALEQLGWKGLLVEARPDSAALCAAARPGMRTVHGALCGPAAPGSVVFRMMAGESEARRSRVGSAHRRGRGRVAAGSALREVEVRTCTLAHLLAGVERVDALVLDLEGGEPEALRGLGAAAATVRCMLIEDPPWASQSAVREFASAHGFVEVAQFALNTLYIHTTQTGLLARARDILHPLHDNHAPVSARPESVIGPASGAEAPAGPAAANR